MFDETLNTDMFPKIIFEKHASVGTWYRFQLLFTLNEQFKWEKFLYSS